MKLKRFLLYGLAASLTSTCLGLYVLAAVLYAIPMISGLLDDSMEVKFDRPNAAIVETTSMGLRPAEGSFYHVSRGSEITPWILLTAVDVSDPNSTKPFISGAVRPRVSPGAGAGRGAHLPHLTALYDAAPAFIPMPWTRGPLSSTLKRTDA